MIKNFFKNIWLWLDNNKTIICAVIVSFATQPFAKSLIGVTATSIILWIFGTGGVLSLIHHAKKGNFSIK